MRRLIWMVAVLGGMSVQAEDAKISNGNPLLNAQAREPQSIQTTNKKNDRKVVPLDNDSAFNELQSALEQKDVLDAD